MSIGAWVTALGVAAVIAAVKATRRSNPDSEPYSICDSCLKKIGMLTLVGQPPYFVEQEFCDFCTERSHCVHWGDISDKDRLISELLEVTLNPPFNGRPPQSVNSIALPDDIFDWLRTRAETLKPASSP